LNGEHGPAETDAPDPRIIARQHTASLLKMLRGYGPVTTAAVAVPPMTARKTPPETAAPMVADAAGTYRCLPEATDRQPTAPSPAGSTANAPGRRCWPGRATPTVGEALHSPSGILGGLMAQVAKLRHASRILQAYLPPHLHRHTTLLRLDPEAWTVQTDSASWATRLHYALHENQQALGAELGFPLPKPRILVVPGTAPASCRRPRLTLTAQNAQLLKIAADNMRDARLSAALQRLAEHAGPRNPASAD